MEERRSLHKLAAVFNHSRFDFLNGSAAKEMSDRKAKKYGVTTTNGLFAKIIPTSTDPIQIIYNSSPTKAFIVSGSNAYPAVVGLEGDHMNRFSRNFPDFLIDYHYMSRLDQDKHPGKAVILVKPKIRGINYGKIIEEEERLFCGLRNFVTARIWKGDHYGFQLFAIDQYFKAYPEAFDHQLPPHHSLRSRSPGRQRNSSADYDHRSFRKESRPRSRSPRRELFPDKVDHRSYRQRDNHKGDYQARDAKQEREEGDHHHNDHRRELEDSYHNDHRRRDASNGSGFRRQAPGGELKMKEEEDHENNENFRARSVKQEPEEDDHHANHHLHRGVDRNFAPRLREEGVKVKEEEDHSDEEAIRHYDHRNFSIRSRVPYTPATVAPATLQDHTADHREVRRSYVKAPFADELEENRAVKWLDDHRRI